MGDDARPGDRVVAGRYALTSELGRGGMGVVWLATDRVLQREVALKEITFAIHLSDEERRVLRERTMREARAAARLDHPCVVSVYDVVEEDGKPWLVMERVHATTLQQLVQQRGPAPPAAAAQIGLDVLAAIDAAHRVGIVHRDVKPGNVLVDENGRACLTDFGIATTTGDSSLTQQGAMLGSPSYMAPERANGHQPRPAMDLWSLGATLFTAVEGRPPFDRGEPMATLLAVVSEYPAPMLRAGPLEPVIRGLLIKDPARRTTAAQAHAQLQAVLAQGTPRPAADVGGPRPKRLIPAPAGPQASPAPAPAYAEAARGGQVERFDVSARRSLASASRAVLGAAARDARDHARHMKNGRPAERPREPNPRPAAPEPARVRFRFKRRWVVLPVVVTVVLVVLILAGLAALLSGLAEFPW